MVVGTNATVEKLLICFSAMPVSTGFTSCYETLSQTIKPCNKIPRTNFTFSTKSQLDQHVLLFFVPFLAITDKVLCKCFVKSFRLKKCSSTLDIVIVSLSISFSGAGQNENTGLKLIIYFLTAGAGPSNYSMLV